MPWFFKPRNHHQKWLARKPADAIPKRKEKEFLKCEVFV